MKIYSIINMKGGVGKTTTACNLAAVLGAFHGLRVLLIDADAQGSASAFFSCGDAGTTLTDVLEGLVDFWPEAVLETEVQGVNVLPADMGLLELDIASVRSGGSENIKMLGGLLTALDEDDAFDVVLIDCPPAFSAASVAAIACSDAVIIPTKIDAWSVGGVREITKQVEAVRRQIRPDLHIAGVLVTMFHNAEVQKQGAELLRKEGLPVYDTVIRRTDKVDEASFARQPLYVWSRNSAAGVDYLRWAGEFMAKEGLVDG